MYGAKGGGGKGFRFAGEEEIQNRPKVTKQLLGRIFSHLKPYFPKLLLALCTILVAAALDVLPATLTGRIIDEGFIGGNFGLLVKLIVITVGVMTTSSLMNVLENYLNTWVSQHIAKDMRNGMYAHLQQMSQRFFADNRQGDIITRMTSDIGGVQSVISNTLAGIVSNVAVLAISLAVMVSPSQCSSVSEKRSTSKSLKVSTCPELPETILEYNSSATSVVPQA